MIFKTRGNQKLACLIMENQQMAVRITACCHSHCMKWHKVKVLMYTQKLTCGQWHNYKKTTQKNSK